MRPRCLLASRHAGKHLTWWRLLQRDATPVVQKAVLQAAGRLIEAQGGSRGRMQTIVQARVPVIKFTEASTGVQCDLTVCNDLAVVKSDFMRRIGGLDGRFVDVIRLVCRCVASFQLSRG